MTKTLITAAVVAAAGVLAAVFGQELLRYVTIRLSGKHPSLVGRSITPQGNETALRERQA